MNFNLFRCNNCCFAFVSNPCTDYEKIYDEAYYNGHGADPLVTYAQELKKPHSSARALEWEGLHLFAKSQRDIYNILDYGCGSGMLASYLKKKGYSAEGWDIGWLASEGIKAGLPVLETKPFIAKYDLIFAIEVIEHVPNPLDTLQEIRSLLRPGGILFLTTGNVLPHWQKDILSWNYFRPEIHISLFSPISMKFALEKTGFSTIEHSYSIVFEKIVTYKILKNLGIHELTPGTKLLANVLRSFAKFVDHRYGVSAMPYGIAK
jgi:2-polyprenyl-3-methyl-5-hydroxy-6-metoxy-1,4-benzoquinol methylase